MFAFSFTACHPLGFIAATLAFCGGLWLGAEARAQTGFALQDELNGQFGPLAWTNEHRFPTQCDPLAPPDRAFEASDLSAALQAPASFMIVEGEVLDIFQGRNRWFINFGPDFRTDFTGLSLLSLTRAPIFNPSFASDCRSAATVVERAATSSAHPLSQWWGKNEGFGGL